MHKKSNYLDEMIMEMSANAQASKTLEDKNNLNTVKKLDKRWKRKYFLENYYMPALSIYASSYSLIYLEGVDWYFSLVPMLMLLGFVFTLAYMNIKTSSIDLSLDLTMYGNKQHKIYKDQLILFRWLKRLGFPVLGVTFASEFVYHVIKDGDIYYYSTILLKVLVLGGLVFYERKSVNELQLKMNQLNT